MAHDARRGAGVTESNEQPEPARLIAEISGLARFGERDVTVTFASDDQNWRTSLDVVDAAGAPAVTTMQGIWSVASLAGDVYRWSFERTAGPPVDRGKLRMSWGPPPVPEEGDLTVRLWDPAGEEWERPPGEAIVRFNRSAFSDDLLGWLLRRALLHQIKRTGSDPTHGWLLHWTFRKPGH
jgi:hypothetical protein